MNIKNLLLIKFSTITVFILLVFSLIILHFSNSFRVKEFNEKLKHYSEKIVENIADSNVQIVQHLFKQHLNIFHNQHIIVFNNSNKIIFESKKFNTEICQDLIAQLNIKSSAQCNNNDTIYIAFHKVYKNNNFTIITSAIDEEGNIYIKSIKLSVLILLVFSLIITFLFGNYFVNQALNPINKVVNQVDKISENNLFERLEIGSNIDEIANLCITFNEMLDRLENSFKLQKSFVSNASHEFRTPLTAMKGQIEVLLLQPRSNEIYLNTYNSLLEDINNQINLINGLGDLANANALFPNVVNSKIPIIDLLDDCVSELYKNKKYKVELTIDELPDNENTMYINGNYALLKSAVINVMDNACKFSNTLSCQVNLICNIDFMTITVVDQGTGINKNDIVNIFESFYRSNNTRHIQGHGIGLSLVKKIVEYYHGKITVASELGKGTKMSIYLPNLDTQNERKI